MFFLPPNTLGMASAALVALLMQGGTTSSIVMETPVSPEVQFVLHRADERGHADHGWLDTHHSFSFAGWHDPKRMHFGALRVLNDDAVAGGGGFGTHPHDNMEIVSIPTRGALEHEDSMGNSSVIRTGDVQIMSAGTGIRHSEFNHSASDPVHFFQVWIFPDERDLTPRYDQQRYVLPESGELACLVSPDGSEGVRIHQNAWFHMGDLKAGTDVAHAIHGAGQGLYVMVMEGRAEIAGQSLGRRDAIGLWDAESVAIHAQEDSRLLLIEVPMRW